MTKKPSSVRKAAKPAGRNAGKAGPKPSPAPVRKIARGTKPVQSTRESQTVEGQLAQREDELAILNSVQEGLASQLDIQGIYDLVGNKVCEIFNPQACFIMLYDKQNNMQLYPFMVEDGVRLQQEPIPHDENGFGPLVMRTRQPLMINENMNERVLEVNSSSVGDGEDIDPKSAIYVPLLLGNEAIGIISIQNMEREHAFRDSDLRLLTTIAASLGTALENARLFKAEQERVAELAIINSVQEGLASKLDIQGIYELVGDKLYEIFKPDILNIAIYHPEMNRTSYPYAIGLGTKRNDLPESDLAGFTGEAIRKRKTIVVNEDLERRMAEVGSYNMVREGPDPQSLVYVPIIAGDEVLGVVSMQSFEPGHVFPESDVRLMETLTNSMSVALQNAQSFKAEQERVAELQIINSIQQGLAAELDFQAIVDLVGDKLREVFNAPDLVITWYDEKHNLVHYLYIYEHGKRLKILSNSPAPGGIFETLTKTRKPVVWNTQAEHVGGAVAGTDLSKSLVSVPIISGDRVLGSVRLENYERENAYGESELRLLTTIAASLGTALENARLFDETQRLFKAEQERVAELQIINSIQQGLAAELDFQAIVDLVGDKLRDVFNTPDLEISWYDEKANLVHYLYMYEHGKRLTISPRPPRPGGMLETQVKTRQPIVFNNAADFAKVNITAVPGTDMGKSLVSVPIISSDRFLGDISIENYERENAYGESELRLLTTIAASLGTALENARLFDETQRLFKAEQERVAELQIINSIQQGLAAELDFQAIVDLVGDKLRDVFRIPDLSISWYDEKASLLHYLYIYEHGARLSIPPRPPSAGGVFESMIKTRQPVVLNNAEDYGRLNFTTIPGTDQSKSAVSLPIIRSDRVLGIIGIENYERENAFGESELRLLTTIAASLGTALENARLFDETQRLLKITEERNAELAIINSVQAALAAELNIQGIYDAVGDKIREIFHDTDMNIRIYDPETKLMHFPYVNENGQRLAIDPTPLGDKGISLHVIRTRETLVINENMAQEAEKYGAYLIPGTQMEKSSIYVPLVAGDQSRGLINLMDMEREHAFSDSDVRLLQTLANSMSVALENARLFDETQRLLKETEQRNAELAIINSVQAALAAELNIQGIYDAVGDKVREIFDQGDVGIRIYDPRTNLVHYPYAYENGERITIPSHSLHEKGFASHVLRTRETVLVNENIAQEAEKYGSYILPGTARPKSQVMVPLVAGDQARGLIEIVEMQHERAFSDSDVRLLQTLANSMSVALENARLFDETQRLLKITEDRAAELAIISSVQQGLASKLDFQSIVDFVGDQIREIFDTQFTAIGIYDIPARVVRFPYVFGMDEREELSPFPMESHVEAYWRSTGQPLVWNSLEELRAVPEYIRQEITGDSDQSSVRSYVGMPLYVRDTLYGAISLQNKERENAYGPSQVRLLQTLAASLGVALENARLFKAEQERVAELAIINSVQAALAAELNIQGIYDAVGDKIRGIFNQADMNIRIYDPKTNLVHYPYLYENGERIATESASLGDKGFEAHIFRTRETVVINENMEREMEKYGSYIIPGTEPSKSQILVPLIVGDQARGLINLMDLKHEHAFSDSDVRLLQTLANSMSVALENARLFDETQRLLKITEDRAAELAIINSVQAGLASKLDMQAIYDLVGNKIRDMFNAQSVIISSFDHEKGTSLVPYAFENGERIIDSESMSLSLLHRHLIETRQPVVINENANEEAKRYGLKNIEGTQVPKSMIYVPFGTGQRVNGYFSLQNMDRENAFADSDVRLLQTLAGSMGIALENARLFNAEQQRVAELAVINSIQQGLAAELDFQTIIDLVGDKVREVLNTGEIGIRWYDAEANIVHYLYEYEHGERITIPSAPPKPGGAWDQLVLTRKPIIHNSRAEMDAAGIRTVPGTDPSKSMLSVPIVGSDRVLGIIVTENYEKENAYTEADVRLLSTVASSMGVALENARLFNETQQRNAELAIINSVQEGLASKLEFQSIINLVGDKITEIFNAQATVISLYLPGTNEVNHRYALERGELLNAFLTKPVAIDKFRKQVVETRQPWLINQKYNQIAQEIGEEPILEGEEPKSLLFVPMIVGSSVTGVISLQNLDVENAFSESDVRLLSTIASSMSVALENARLFEAEQQRVAELAIINSVQQGLASKLDMQAIYDLVGDKICEIFSLQTCYIMIYDREKNLEHYPFLVDDGKRIVQEDLVHDENGFGPLVMKARQPIMINEDMEERSKEVNSYDISTEGDPVKAAVYVPLLIGDEAKGVISVQNTQREHAYTESDLRLLTTLASSMSVALESARLFDETEQRAAELATINSIQEGLASKLTPQAIYDLVGEKLREVFGAQFLYIAIHDRETNLIHFPYFWERDHREITEEPIRYGEGLTSHVIETRQPLVINTDWLKRATELGGVFLEGENPKSSMSVPIMSGNTAIGVISLQSTVAENQYSESEVRLLSTITSSVGVALESARLFNETEQRAAELAIINEVQEGLASKLEVQAIYELVGGKLRELFGKMAISLVTFDLKKDIYHYEYIVEKGQRLEVPDSPITLTGRHLIRTRQTLLVNDNIVENLAKIGITMQIIPGTETPQSILRVPIQIGDRVHGFIGLSDLDRENAFSLADVRLLQTLAGSLSVALENARLFEETSRNAAELATVNTVSSALASELDIDPLIQLVGEQARAIFTADIVYVALLDEAGKTINFPYTFGEELLPMDFGEGLTSKIIQTGKPLLINQDVDKQIQELGATTVGVITQSYLGVPIFVGARAVGVISVQSVSRQGAFDENAERLLTTIASNVGSALQNARLYREAQESRTAAEQANKAKSAFLANMSHELRTPLNAIIGFTRIVRRKAEGALPDKQTDNLDKVLTSAEHLLNLINTVLDIAKIEAGRMEVQASNFNISALADQCANTATPLLKSSVRLEKEIDSALTIIHSDQDKIKQIILNLLSNAAKFTHEGRIVLRMRRVEPNLIVDVIDSGIGISEEALGRIFDEFQQADTSTTRQYGGTGLGLSISRNLARLLGGDLSATSDGVPGKGSTFTLTIPIQYGFRSASAAKPEPESTPQATHLLKADASKKLILVIDDDPDAVYLLQENLSPEEFEVVGTRNGLEGQQMARDLQPQAILLDIIMPDKDGWQVLHDLKADDLTKDIPVILLTIVDKKALGFQLGASAYLLKPLDPVAVFEALKRVTIHDGNGHVRVLVVDDDPNVADMLRQTLPESHFRLDSAEDGVAGLQAIEAHRPDVVLLDIMMPRLDGFGVIEQLRAGEGTRELPIIVISAKELTDDESTRLKESVAFVMKKQGFDGEKLIEEINSVVAHPS